MSVEIIEAQEQLQRARDNLRHVEEGIKKTATSSNLRFGDKDAGRGRPGRGRPGRLMGRLGGVQRFRAENDNSVDSEPPLKKSLSSVASRLGPLNIENKPDNDNDDDAPTLKSTVTLSQIQDRDSASSIVNDAKTLNRSKRLFGSLLMGTLRQFKQEKEKTKSSESKQAKMWDKINQKEAEQVALTAADRRRLETAKDEVNQEIRLLEEKMELAEMVS
ncbi:pinin-like [Bolinopsis microptera]|uniref:pinin-like n=1 Tax=Bolinopsis microptera TaxID=2820187 RepID=UPI0030790349